MITTRRDEWIRLSPHTSTPAAAVDLFAEALRALTHRTTRTHGDTRADTTPTGTSTSTESSTHTRPHAHTSAHTSTPTDAQEPSCPTS